MKLVKVSNLDSESVKKAKKEFNKGLRLIARLRSRRNA